LVCSYLHIALFHLHIGNVYKFDDKAKIVRWGYVSVDSIIDIFVTIRLIQILREGIQNVAELDQMIERTPRDKVFNEVKLLKLFTIRILLFNVLTIKIFKLLIISFSLI
jgi:hypothetical protein